MRFYTKQHKFYGGIDLHARTMYLCILNQTGEIVLQRNMRAAPEPFLQAIAPSREDLVVCVEGLFTWYWLADLCTQEGIPFVLGHALYMKAIHGGKAKNDKIDAQKIAVLLRGCGPQNYRCLLPISGNVRRWSSLLTSSTSKATGSNSPPTHSNISSCSGCCGSCIASRKSA